MNFKVLHDHPVVCPICGKAPIVIEEPVNGANEFTYIVTCSGCQLLSGKAATAFPNGCRTKDAARDAAIEAWENVCNIAEYYMQHNSRVKIKKSRFKD